MKATEILKGLLAAGISPTWAIAAFSKRGTAPNERAKGIIRRNVMYAAMSLVTLLLLDVYLTNLEWRYRWALWVAYFYGYVIAWSRCNEITLAFLSDALDKSAGSPSRSTLNSRRRIELALVSYLELIMNFAFLYLLLMHPIGSVDVPRDAVDAFYFSGVTITTLGYGDFKPDSSLTKLLVVQEVLAGFTLLIVSFAVYAGREVNANKKIHTGSA